MKSPIKYLFIVSCILSSLIAFSQNPAIDSLKLALKNAKHDTTACSILNAMIEAEPDNELWPKYNEQLKTLAEKNIAKDKALKKVYLNHLAAAYNNLGYLADYQGNTPAALEAYHQCLEIREEIGDKQGIAGAFNNIASKYQDQGDIAKALEFHHKSLKIKEEINDKKGIAVSLNNLGFIYRDQNDFQNTLLYFQKSLKIYEEIGDKQGMARSLNNIGYAYEKQNDSLIPIALNYFQKSLKIYEEIGQKEGMAMALHNIAFFTDKQGNTNKALERYQESLKIREGIKDKKGIAATLNSIAALLTKKGSLNEALVYASRGMQIAKELAYPIKIKSSAGVLKIIYQKQNKHKEAFEMFELEIKMRDSINNQETQKAAVKKQMQYEYEKKELQLKAEQDKKDVIASEELKQKEKERNYFMLGFGLVIVLALFIFRGYRQKQSANKLITHQKQLVEEKQKEILDSIHYAKRIQMALMTNENYIKKSLERLMND